MCGTFARFTRTFPQVAANSVSLERSILNDISAKLSEPYSGGMGNDSRRLVAYAQAKHEKGQGLIAAAALMAHLEDTKKNIGDRRLVFMREAAVEALGAAASGSGNPYVWVGGNMGQLVFLSLK